MTKHELYPDWVLLKYTSSGRSKQAILPCVFSGSVSPGTQPEVTRRAGASQLVGAAVAAYVSVLQPFFNTSDTFDSYEAYHKATLTSPPLFVYGAPLALAGTASSADTAYCEMVFTFKTPEPGGLKLYLMEPAFPVDTKDPLPTGSNTTIDALNTFILGANDWIVGRNNNFPLLGLFVTSKQNDFYRRKYKL